MLCSLNGAKLCVVLCMVFCFYPSSEGRTVGVLLGDYPSQEQRLLNSTIAKKYAKGEIIFSANVQRVSEIDSFGASKTLCEVLSTGVLAIFGPRYTPATTILESICLEFEVPYISYSWRPRADKDKGFFMNFFPETNMYAHSLGEIVRSFGWKSFVVIYEKDDTLLKLKEVLNFQKYNEKDKRNKIAFEKLGPGPDYSELFAKVERSTQTNIILDCKTEHIKPLLRQAKEANLLNVYNNYFLIDMDALTLDYSDLNTTANITTIRLFDDHDNSLKETIRKIGLAELIHYRKLKTDTALFYDALWYVHDTVKFLPLLLTNVVHCNGSQKSKNGMELSLSLKDRYASVGITGPLEFDAKGSRVDFNLIVVDVLQNKKIATWFENNQSLIVNEEVDKSVAVVNNLQSTKVIVSSKLGAPYLMQAEADDGEILEGNARYEGFCLDLIAQIAKIVGFEFEIQLTEGGSYGFYDEIEDKWTGLIGDVLEKKAHLAISDITITQEREEVVDFSLPFMELGISLLHSKPDFGDTQYFVFLSRFSKSLWTTILYSYIAISVCLYIVLRLSPDDWERRHPCDELDDTLVNRWDLKNSLLLTLRALTMQGSDAVPKGKSARLAISMWWLFCLILTSYYIANTANVANLSNLESPLQGVDDLTSQTQIKYGMLKGGSTEDFFRNSNTTTYAKLWHYIEHTPAVFTKTTQDGVDRVLESNGQYAFFMESTTLEYALERNCNLRQVGGLLDTKSYGIAMPQNAPYRGTINRAILKLQEEGILLELKQKWWSAEEPCSIDEESSVQMKPENVAGLFVILGVGIVIAFGVAVFEFVWNAKRVAKEEGITYCEAVCDGLKMASSIWTNRRKIRSQ
ncbi:unnamed protein product [Psylliodes chrysocephalus]|uniref:Glutamate receptor ionotropic, kainate 2 n=1 Tax=Psylliodes chrysocephalus TaxID=3402493 RepID=A0A9P0G6A4_9CUCU|nr:unnamed protein product [Psylliodes chrysocephala]